uniref:Calcium homeostasis modulator 3 n=1 Tax=Latimeria chalumnae TaxID=7897 RepID=H2ZZ80_LATCH|nr:PREDICTED: calcium homeostasis modulator protein 3 [Latimeria chalumnae]|eukprot:XP_006012480.1 PREDICTED: calcium homeostasis modulator protein 3 [Latimeria chalumnae]
MDRFRMIFQYFQSNSESVMNGICGILALASIKIYTSFDFNCPCLPRYNTIYGMGVMFIPPIVLFLCGVILNKHSLMMLEEWKRPTGRRKKNPAVLRYMFVSTIQKALFAPVIWIIVTLLDGKCFVCAFSSFVDPEKFSGFSNASGMDVRYLLAKVACKEDQLMRNNTSRKAVSRYLRCWSQAFGWSILLFLILLACLARSLKPCFSHTAFLQTRYWSNYIDIEQKLFDETCCEHARDFARRCILHFFENMQGEMRVGPFPSPEDGGGSPGAKREEEEGKSYLHGITNKEQVNQLLRLWYQSKPPLDVGFDTQQQAKAHLSIVWDKIQNRSWYPAQETGRTMSKQTDV